MKTRLVLCILLATVPVQAAPRGTPPDPYTDKGACPFECCTYRDWKTQKPVMLLDKPNGTKTIAQIPAGTKVRALTGEVISHPVRMIATADQDDAPIRKGDAFYALHYSGEGYWAAWFKGRVYSLDMTDYPDDKGPLANFKADWWVQLRIGGKTGWVLNTGQFDNMDSCG